MKRILIVASLIVLSSWATLAESIPTEANAYKRTLTKVSHAHWGLDAPVALFAGQIHQESGWRIDARSPAGAQGLAQFMPATAEWFHRQNPRDLGQPFGAFNHNQPYNPAWALSALVLYDRHLYRQIQAATPCERWAKTLSAYNGGVTWLKRDEQLASASGADALVWFDGVERYNSGRSAAAYRENRHYPKTIITRWQPMYASAGWGLGGVCYAF
jgi:soluble lytic murein transglycosylase-like protein